MARLTGNDGDRVRFNLDGMTASILGPLVADGDDHDAATCEHCRHCVNGALCGARACAACPNARQQRREAA